MTLSVINFSILFFLITFKCDVTIHGFSSKAQKKSYIRILNNSKHELKEIAVFSIKFKNLKKGCKTKYKKLVFNELKDDPMMYLSAGENKFAMYLKPEINPGKYTYVIDSFNIDNRYIYFRTITK